MRGWRRVLAPIDEGQGEIASSEISYTESYRDLQESYRSIQEKYRTRKFKLECSSLRLLLSEVPYISTGHILP